MKVKELINKLNNYDGNKEIGISISNGKQGQSDKTYVAGKKTIYVEDDKYMVSSLNKTIWINGFYE